jgi:hypothetical protein
MKLFEIRRSITETIDDHWSLIKVGPLFNYALGTTGDVATVFGYHSVRAVLAADIDIAIEYGMSSDPLDHRRVWTEEWAPFADPEIHGEYCDVYYRDALVDRVELATVDGSRATLPVPLRRDGEWVALDWPYQLARLVDSFEGGRDFEGYFSRSGIRKWPA